VPVEELAQPRGDVDIYPERHHRADEGHHLRDKPEKHLDAHDREEHEHPRRHRPIGREDDLIHEVAADEDADLPQGDPDEGHQDDQADLPLVGVEVGEEAHEDAPSPLLADTLV